MKKLEETFCELIIKDGYLRLKMPKGDIINDYSIVVDSFESKTDDEDKTIDNRKYRLAHATVVLPILIKK